MTHKTDLERCSLPGSPLRPDQTIWVIASRGFSVPARCVRTEGVLVWVEYPDGRTATVNIRETAPRYVEEASWTPLIDDRW